MDRAPGWTATDLTDQSDRTFVVTGASSGLGAAITRHLAARGGRVVMAVRDTAKGARVRAELLHAHPRADLVVRRLDLLDLDSVHAFVEGLDRDVDTVDALVNNAGIGTVPRRLSPQGVESQFATNHLGHFALTGRLLPALTVGRSPVVVTVSSGLYPLGRLDLTDLAAERRYSAAGAYATSKLANVLFGLELDRRLRAAGSPVRSLLTHPGMTRTDLSRDLPPLARRIETVLMGPLRRPLDEAAAPMLFAATVPTAPTGRHIGPGRLFRRAEPTFAPLRGPATDRRLAADLWARSEEITGVRLTPTPLR
ncbi:SDR family NAD(P)-dependent oxidoreductase [Micromonospora sp. HUAS LYJ1]|uniref:SDR family NAD(P)-dependent oxidoreductase n=1 Tax=Micromonospora sp. HUAS LYJ1 TaxID=3061626 RepID=UPI002672FF52|nr:SDR family NAD(P)-dependent oxidoreductase [Micromonospora sp. HUAS LYJ1]WKU02908.1 SDR family NAD(P)-dependent oxidoreductase [Micromonospora sp. HUAS LYJ1]